MGMGASILDAVAGELGGSIASAKRLGGLGNECYKLVLETGGGLEQFSVKIYQGRDAREKAAKEYRIYSLMPSHGLNAPKIVLADTEGKLTGRPLLAWRWIDGESADRFLSRKSASLVARLLGRTLAAFHSIPPGEAGFSGRGGVFWIDELRAAMLLSGLAGVGMRSPKSLGEHLRVGVDETLIHGDYNPGNVLVAREGAYIIDQEGSGCGDPVYDLAYCALFIYAGGNWGLVKAFLRGYANVRRVDLTGFSTKMALVAVKLYAFLSLGQFKNVIRQKTGLAYPVAELIFLRPLRKKLLKIIREAGLLGA